MASSRSKNVALAVAAGATLGVGAYYLYKEHERRAARGRGGRLLLPTSVVPRHYQLFLQVRARGPSAVAAGEGGVCSAPAPSLRTRHSRT